VKAKVGLGLVILFSLACVEARAHHGLDPPRALGWRQHDGLDRAATGARHLDAVAHQALDLREQGEGRDLVATCLKHWVWRCPRYLPASAEGSAAAVERWPTSGERPAPT
jgi:hypothetical protein